MAELHQCSAEYSKVEAWVIAGYLYGTLDAREDDLMIREKYG